MDIDLILECVGVIAYALFYIHWIVLFNEELDYSQNVIRDLKNIVKNKKAV